MKCCVIFIQKLQKSPSAGGFPPHLLASGGWGTLPLDPSLRQTDPHRLRWLVAPAPDLAPNPSSPLRNPGYANEPGYFSEMDLAKDQFCFNYKQCQ